MGKSALVDVPTEAMDQLALVNEVLAKRQEEAESARIQLSNLRHSIRQEQTQWEEQRRQEEYALRTKRLELEQAHANRMADADAMVQARQMALNQAEAERHAVVQDRVRLAEERRQLGDLNHERVEVERIRASVMAQQQDMATKWQESQAALNTANQRLTEADKKLAEVERQTGDLNRLQVELEAKREELNLRAKHLNIVQAAIGQVVEKLPVDSPPLLSSVPTAPSVESLTPSVVPPPLEESRPSSPSMSLPPLPPGLNPEEVEIAPQVMPQPGMPTVPLPPEVSGEEPSAGYERPYVHPSQRRVFDGTKPLNEQ